MRLYQVFEHKRSVARTAAANTCSFIKDLSSAEMSWTFSVDLLFHLVREIYIYIQKILSKCFAWSTYNNFFPIRNLSAYSPHVGLFLCLLFWHPHLLLLNIIKIFKQTLQIKALFNWTKTWLLNGNLVFKMFRN